MDYSGKMGMFMCAMSHGYVAKGCTAHLCDVLLVIPSFAPVGLDNDIHGYHVHDVELNCVSWTWDLI